MSLFVFSFSSRFASVYRKARQWKTLSLSNNFCEIVPSVVVRKLILFLMLTADSISPLFASWCFEGRGGD